MRPYGLLLLARLRGPPEVVVWPKVAQKWRWRVVHWPWSSVYELFLRHIEPHIIYFCAALWATFACEAQRASRSCCVAKGRTKMKMACGPWDTRAVRIPRTSVFTASLFEQSDRFYGCESIFSAALLAVSLLRGTRGPVDIVVRPLGRTKYMSWRFRNPSEWQQCRATLFQT